MLDNPIDAYIRVAQAKNQNRLQTNQDIGNIGQSLGQGLGALSQQLQAQKQKALMNLLMEAMKSQGSVPQGPQMPTGPMIQGPQGYTPPGAGASAVPAGRYPMPPKPQPLDNTNLINSLMMRLDPQSAIKANFENQDPLRQAKTRQALASAKHLEGLGSPIPGSTTKVWRKSDTGETTDQPPADLTGWVEYNVKPGQALQTLSNKSLRDNLSGIKWDNLTPGEQSFAKNIYNGDIDISSLGPREKSRYAYAANLYADQNKLPAYQSFGGKTKAATAKAITSGKPGMNVLSLNTAIGHAGTAMEAYAALKNTDERFMNKGINWLKANTNDPNIVKLDIALNALHGELATVFKGTAGTDQEIGEWKKALESDLTLKQASQAIPQIITLLKSRQAGLEDMRNRGMSNRPGAGPLLSPHAQEIIGNLTKPGQNSAGGNVQISNFTVTP